MFKINFFKKHLSLLVSLLASGIIGFSLDWYFFREQGRLKFIQFFPAYFVGCFLFYHLFKIIYRFLVKRFQLSTYWQADFYKFLDYLFLALSGYFLIIVSGNEIISFLLSAIFLFLLYFSFDRFLAKHPNATSWRAVNRSFFLLGTFVFLSSYLFQHYAYRHYFLEIKYSGFLINYVVVFRSLQITLFWLGTLSLITLVRPVLKKRLSYTLVSFWALAFALAILASIVNLGILHFSGLYLNPTMIAYARGGTGLVSLPTLAIALSAAAILLFIFYKILVKVKRDVNQAPRKYWYAYATSLLLLAGLSFIVLPFYKNTPEYLIGKSFYNHFFLTKTVDGLEPDLIKKLENFGLNFQDGVVSRGKAYSGESLLPKKFSQTKPNIIIVFAESFSSRLTSVYNPAVPDLTPGLEAMAKDPNTTVFKNFYNSATPTVNGLVAELCSVMVPTGQTGIINNEAIRRNTPCLPDILKKEAGYTQAIYLTSVEKNYSNKDKIIADTGVNQILGKNELAKLISGKPLSWGYSDHQTFPVLFDLASKQSEPFLLMLSTVDTHPPFNIAKDTVKYQTGASNLLNSYHTTDNAFAGFWHNFKNSKLSDNTILVVVADHAVFPTAYTSDEDKKLLADVENQKITFYDQNLLMIYLPETTLPKEVNTYSSSLDLTPTLLQILGINPSNFFEGLSIFSDRPNFPNLLGMNEYELYINQLGSDGKRHLQSGQPNDIVSKANNQTQPVDGLSLTEYLKYYQWKKNSLAL